MDERGKSVRGVRVLVTGAAGFLGSHLRERLAAEEHVPFVDLLNAVKDQDPPKLWVTAPDPHPNGYANQLYAKYLFPILNGMLPSPSAS